MNMQKLWRGITSSKNDAHLDYFNSNSFIKFCAEAVFLLINCVWKQIPVIVAIFKFNLMTGF